MSKERGYEFNHASQSTKTRADVLKELESSQKASAAGMNGPLALSQGNRGYVNEQHSLAFQNGRLVHTDNLAHNSPKPSLAMTAEERRQSEQLYRN